MQLLISELMELPDSPVISRPMKEITKGNKNIINNNIPQPIPPTIETINITTISEIITNNPMKLSIDIKPGVAIASLGIESKDISKKKVQIIVSQATHTVHLPITTKTKYPITTTTIIILLTIKDKG